jgi:hypothetical protein
MKFSIIKYFFILLSGCLFASCNDSNDDQRAIWLFEQHQIGNPDFQFYPDKMEVVGTITVKDSLQLLKEAFNKPIETVIAENNRHLDGLLQLQSLYIKYDLENQRIALVRDIDQLEKVSEWLTKIKSQLKSYNSMPSDKVLVRKVACKFFYYDLLGQRITKDNLYLISASKNVVLSSTKR